MDSEAGTVMTTTLDPRVTMWSCQRKRARPSQRQGRALLSAPTPSAWPWGEAQSPTSLQPTRQGLNIQFFVTFTLSLNFSWPLLLSLILASPDFSFPFNQLRISQAAPTQPAVWGGWTQKCEWDRNPWTV